MIQLKDVIHFYLGCDCHVDAGQFPERVLPILGSIGNKALLGKASICFVEIVDCKPILRPLSDMTEEERQRFSFQDEAEWKDLFADGQLMKNKFHVWEFLELLKMHFDLFGLIESGQAIDSTTLK